MKPTLQKGVIDVWVVPMSLSVPHLTVTSTAQCVAADRTGTATAPPTYCLNPLVGGCKEPTVSRLFRGSQYHRVKTALTFRLKVESRIPEDSLLV